MQKWLFPNYLSDFFLSAVDWIQWATSPPAGVHWYCRRQIPSSSLLLPGPPSHRKDSQHCLPGENNEWHQSPGDPFASREQHVCQVLEATSPYWDLVGGRVIFLGQLQTPKHISALAIKDSLPKCPRENFALMHAVNYICCKPWLWWIWPAVTF